MLQLAHVIGCRSAYGNAFFVKNVGPTANTTIGFQKEPSILPCAISLGGPPPRIDHVIDHVIEPRRLLHQAATNIAGECEARRHEVNSGSVDVVSAAPTGRVKQFAFINTLRGIAALWVVVFHMALVPAFRPMLPAGLADFVMAGSHGVTLFFVISAFTLSHSIRDRTGEPNSTLAFYFRRAFRIVPLFYFWLLLSVIRDAWLLGIGQPGKSIVLSILFGFNFFPSKQEGIVWASWTLGV